MPARSEAQRRYLYATKGAAWAKAHGFDTKGKLPARVGKKKRKAKPKKRRKTVKKAKKKKPAKRKAKKKAAKKGGMY